MSSTGASLSLRRALIAGVAAAALGTGALAAQDANAAFTIGACQGSGSVKGQGASFQRDLQSSLKRLFEESDGCGGAVAGPSYNPNGSGNGLASAGAGGGSDTILCAQGGAAIPCTLVDRKMPVGQRDLNVSFQATDEPPTAEQTQRINAGLPGEADDARAHLIPIATGSTAFIMHAPEGCAIGTVTNLTDRAQGTVGGADTGDTAANRTQRIRIRSDLLEKAFAGASDADTWGEIAPGISGAPSSGQYAGLGIADCASVPVRRIVRQDVSGTTYGWKAYLNLINPGRGWLTTYNTPDNRTWPAAGGSGAAVATLVDAGTTQVCPIGGNNLCSARSSNAANLSNTVRLVDGSIGYADLATARGAGFDISPSASVQDYTFWSPLQNNPGGTPTGYAEPTAAPEAHSGSIGEKGANCANVAVQNVPTPANSPGGDPTYGDWSRAFAAGGANYPACVLTYVLAWDDNAPVYGVSSAEEAKARTVKDYLQKAVVSSVGQLKLAAADYSRLPNPQAAPLLTYAQNAVDAIDWNKAAGGGQRDPPREQPREQPRPAPRSDPPRSVPAPPSNAFSIPSRKATATLLTFTVELPGAGALKVDATTKVGRRTLKVASAAASPSGSGRVTVRLTLSSAAKKALARARGKKLKVDVTFTYTPTGGTARTVTQSVTVRAASRRPARRGGRRSNRKKPAKR